MTSALTSILPKSFTSHGKVLIDSKGFTTRQNAFPKINVCQVCQEEITFTDVRVNQICCQKMVHLNCYTPPCPFKYKLKCNGDQKACPRNTLTRMKKIFETIKVMQSNEVAIYQELAKFHESKKKEELEKKTHEALKCSLLDILKGDNGLYDFLQLIEMHAPSAFSKNPTSLLVFLKCQDFDEHQQGILKLAYQIFLSHKKKGQLDGYDAYLGQIEEFIKNFSK